ncbi:MAG: metabolite traffic protein EboE [Planctomycetota bacterium]
MNTSDSQSNARQSAMSRSAISQSPVLGYCTNVHAGTDVGSILGTLEDISGRVRREVGVDSLGVGLWLPDSATSELLRTGVEPLSEVMRANALAAYTINGFPFANFHAKRVKHAVYRPTWWEPERARYTENLAHVLAALLPDHADLGTISTLPLGWPLPKHLRAAPSTDDDQYHAGVLCEKHPQWLDEEQVRLAAKQLQTLAEQLKALESETGKRIVIAIEPEPGCLLHRTQDLIALFDAHLDDPTSRRYLSVCHDICHAAVMGESQETVLKQYADAEITIGKVQVSSAIVAHWRDKDRQAQDAMLDQLRSFAEDRYLHQTGVWDREGQFTLFGDLPELIEASREHPELLESHDRWVIHFHVPVFLENFGALNTTRQDVETVFAVLASELGTYRFTGQWEIETYAWSVMPESMRQSGLVADIASEVGWCRRLMDPTTHN